MSEEFKEHQAAVEKDNREHKAAVEKENREHKAATADSLDKIFTVMQDLSTKIELSIKGGERETKK